MNNLKKDFWNTLGTLIFCSTSLVYTVIITRYTSLNNSGIFTFAFSFACLMVTLASFGGRTYQVTDVKNEISPYSYIITRFITVIFSILLMFLFLIIKDYNFYKSAIIIILCLFKFLEEISDVYYGIIQKNNKLYKIGQFQIIKSIINVLIFYLIIRFTRNIVIALISIIINNLIFLLIERNFAKKLKKWKKNINKEEIKKILKINFYICGYTFLSSFIINYPKYAIDTYLNNDIQAIYNILIMPATLIALISGFILNPLIVNISNKIEENKIIEVKQIIKKITIVLIILSIFALLLIYLFGINLLEFIYNLELSKYKNSLLLIIIGSIFYAYTNILATILIAMRKIKIQFFVGLLCIIISIIVSNILVIKYNVYGGCYSYIFIMIFRAIVYIMLYKKIITKK